MYNGPYLIAVIIFCKSPIHLYDEYESTFL